MGLSSRPTGQMSNTIMFLTVVSFSFCHCLGYKRYENGMTFNVNININKVLPSSSHLKCIYDIEVTSIYTLLYTMQSLYLCNASNEGIEACGCTHLLRGNHEAALLLVIAKKDIQVTLDRIECLGTADICFCTALVLSHELHQHHD